MTSGSVLRRAAPPVVGAASLMVAAGLGTLAYALWEAKQYELRHVEIAVDMVGPPIRVLHLSDTHLAIGQDAREQWVAGLADVRPDLVIVTGDLVSSTAAMSRLPDLLGPLLAYPGAFVLGSNDYYPAHRINPAKYFRGPSSKRDKWPTLPTDRIRSFLTDSGWLDLDNRAASLSVGGRVVGLAGTGDAHIQLDDYPAVAGSWPADADVRIGVTHAPYRRVVAAMAADGADVVFAGHTHGGQVCVPGWGALVSNCDLPPRQASGVSQWQGVPLHVSAGVGTNPYAPIRVACRPGATVVTLVAG